MAVRTVYDDLSILLWSTSYGISSPLALFLWVLAVHIIDGLFFGRSCSPKTAVFDWSGECSHFRDRCR